MIKTISKDEKTDIMLALALAFEKKLGDSPSPGETFAELPEKYFAAALDEELTALGKRAAFLDELPEENRRLWQEIQLEKIRRRGLSLRLDENINPSHLAEFLSREATAVQQLILRNLPADLSRKIALYLELNFEIKHLIPEPNEIGKPVSDEINALVKRKFLANFISFEDLHEPDTLDKFSVHELDNFIRHLGLREIAIACRGISSKETLAAFLNRFSEDDAREMALYITELEDVRPFWVAQADELVRQNWSADLPPETILRKIGLRLLATAYRTRGETSRRYASQKLSMRDSANWQKAVRENEKILRADETQEGAHEESANLEIRQKEVERLAVTFAQTGRL